jgi:hypothetical protein
LRSHPNDPLLHDLEKKSLVEYETLCKGEESLLKQKERVQWLSEGDQNTASIFKSANARFNRNKIVSIQREDGTELRDYNLIKNEIFRYYEGLLGSPCPTSYPGRDVLSCFIIRYLRSRLSPWLSQLQMKKLIIPFSA